MQNQENKENTSTQEAATVVKDPQLEKYRVRKAFWLAIIGLILAAILVVVLLAYGIKTSADIVAIVGLFTSVLGTLVGAFFGIQVGSAGKENAEARANKSEQKTSAILGLAPPEVVAKAMQLFPHAFE